MDEGTEAGRGLRGARDAATNRISEAREVAAGRISDARDAASERIGEARDAAAQRVADARDAAAEVVEKVKPRLRGVSHQWAFVVALVAGAVLVATAPDGRATFAAAVYAGSLVALLGTSALYHRVNWRRPEIRRWMRRLDHSMIFLLIAGTVTPFALLVLDGTLATAILIAAWAGALAGIVVEMIWVEAPKWVAVTVYLVVGWIGLIAYPAIINRAGLGAGLLIAGGAVLYTAGALIYAAQRPDPRPAVFGYHEIFHLLVIAAAALHFAAVAIYAVPAG
jgi:hemolysin III